MKIKDIQDSIHIIKNKIILNSLPNLKRKWTPPKTTYKI